jgi:16S rRNA (guanine(966)-N(2))-methyltransferase RsmD
MSERMRIGLFNVLGDIEGMRILDCYSGTGMLSIESLSRDARSSTAVESNFQAQKAILFNLKSINLTEKVNLSKMSVENYIKNNHEKFDLIFCDPPYDALNFETLVNLEDHLSPKGIIVISFPVNTDLPIFNSIKLLKDKTYGGGRLVFFR